MSANVEQSGFVGRVLGSRWVVGEQLGSGSFGVVHAGIERGTGAAVAVKLLHPQFLHHGETIARFWNEAEALRRMNHPNVLSLLDVGVSEDGVPFIVTELLTGETLRDLLNREGALPPERAMRLLGPAAHALHHAHLAGIVHRDLKPENIFRVRKDGMGTTKILDFGVAKLLDTNPGKKLSQTGIMIGTMAYSPPEQMQGLGDIDHRADQFGFAALMFEALTGRRPFPQSQPFALFQAVMSGARPNATDLRPDLPRAVDAVIIRGLEGDREKRFRTVEEFYLALTSALTMPNFPDISTTFNGAPARPGRLDSVPMAPIARPPAHANASATPAPKVAGHLAASAPAPSAPMGEMSARYRPIEEELTRGDAAQANANITMMSGAPARAPQTTLAEGAQPPSRRASNVTLQSGFDSMQPPAPSSALTPASLAPASAPMPAASSAASAPLIAPSASTPLIAPSEQLPLVAQPQALEPTTRSSSRVWIVLFFMLLVVGAGIAILMLRR